MGKYLVPVGLVWVGLSLVLGLVIAFDTVSFKPVIREGDTILKKEVYYYSIKDENPNPNVNSGVAKVNVEGTYGYEGEESATAKVKIDR